MQFLLTQGVNVAYHRNKMTQFLRQGDRQSAIKFLRSIYILIFEEF